MNRCSECSIGSGERSSCGSDFEIVKVATDRVIVLLIATFFIC